MNITRFSIQRPVGITMVFLFFVVLGLYSFNRIGVELLPALNTPFVTVYVEYKGAGAEEVEKQVIEPLEEALSSLSKLKQMTATARQGSAYITLEFDFTANADLAAIDASKKVDSVRNKLPDNIETPVVYKRDANATAILEIAITADQPLYDTYYAVDDIFRERLQRIAGVSEITILGGRQKEVSVELDRDKLTLHKISPQQVVDRIKKENLTSPSGTVFTAKTESGVRVIAEFENLQQIADLQITVAEASIPLKDLATIREQIVRPTRITRANGRESVSMLIYKNSDANLLETSRGLQQQLARLRADFPQYEFRVISDASDYVNASLRNTLGSLFEGIMTTGLVLYLFLRSWHSTITVLIAIPTSLLSTLFIMYLSGFTFNLMSLMGMALCIGILVDDSIVVLENIHRHLHMGKPAALAAEEGRNEIGMAALAITLCDIVVFLPIAFMTGMTGQFFRQFGLTIVFATVFSLFVSFTLTPMLASRFYKNGVHESKGKFWQQADRFEQRVTQTYEKLLRWSLDNRRKIIASALALFCGVVSLVPLKIIGAEYMPRTDEAQFRVFVELPVGSNMETTSLAAQKVEEYIRNIPEVTNALSQIGWPNSNMSSITVQLVKKRERQRSVWQITDQIRGWARRSVPEAIVRISETQSSVSGVATTQGMQAAVQIEVLGQDMDELIAASNRIQKILAEIPGAKDIRSTHREGQPELQVTVDRERLKFYNASITDVTDTLKAAITGQNAGVFRKKKGDEIDITVRFRDGDTFKASDIKAIPLINSSNLIFVGDVTQIRESSGPVFIRRVDKQRAINVAANLTDRPLDEVLSEISQRLSKENLGPFISYRFTGQAENMKDTFREMMWALILSLILVYIVLAILYESIITPIIRMFSLPLGLIGSLLFLLLTGNTINLFSLIGVLMMDGLVAKNGTLLIDYALTLIDRGEEPRDAIIEAGKARLRPIVMTTMTMVVGMLPTALAVAEGAENRVSMAWVLIGGLLSSTFFTLVIIPIIFLFFYKSRRNNTQTPSRAI